MTAFWHRPKCRLTELIDRSEGKVMTAERQSDTWQSWLTDRMGRSIPRSWQLQDKVTVDRVDWGRTGRLIEVGREGHDSWKTKWHLTELIDRSDGKVMTAERQSDTWQSWLTGRTGRSWQLKDKVTLDRVDWQIGWDGQSPGHDSWKTKWHLTELIDRPDVKVMRAERQSDTWQSWLTGQKGRSWQLKDKVTLDRIDWQIGWESHDSWKTKWQLTELIDRSDGKVMKAERQSDTWQSWLTGWTGKSWQLKDKVTLDRVDWQVGREGHDSWKTKWRLTELINRSDGKVMTAERQSDAWQNWLTGRTGKSWQLKDKVTLDRVDWQVGLKVMTAERQSDAWQNWLTGRTGKSWQLKDKVTLDRVDWQVGLKVMTAERPSQTKWHVRELIDRILNSEPQGRKEWRRLQAWHLTQANYSERWEWCGCNCLSFSA